MKIRYRYLEEGEEPTVPVFPGPYMEPVVLQEQDSAGNWHDVQIKPRDEQ